MLRKLDATLERYESINRDLSLPEIISDRNKYRDLTRELSEITPTVTAYNKYRKLVADMDSNKAIISESESAGGGKSAFDLELVELARTELESQEKEKESLEAELKRLILPKDPNDSKNCLLEIRAGTGGDEAALFAADLFRMYSRYAEKNKWRMDLLSSSPTGIGGYKEIIVVVEGAGAYGKLKFESGIHRVQRVPKTEAQGRIHTSAVTVAIMPEAEEVDVKLDPNEIRIDVFRSGGHGGQSVNTTDSAVRITHIPTGLVVSMQDEKSQHKNKAKAMKILLARLKDLEESKVADERAKMRKDQVGSGDRSGRIRTYNFPQGRITDHRINLTMYRLEAAMNGEIDEIIEALQLAKQTEQLTGTVTQSDTSDD